jgi:hypothetical protein
MDHRLAGRRGRIDRLLVEVQIDVAGLERLSGAEQIDQRSAEPIDRPCHNNVKAAPLGVPEHFVQAGPHRGP